MAEATSTINFEKLRSSIKGDLFTDNIHRLIYATDGSAYREVPEAVVRPACKDDIKKTIGFARENGISIIPRGAGTSLAGQVVGSGIVVDVSKYMNSIIEVNPAEKWVMAEPGVVLSELNNHLLQYGLMFAPETSTANRCCIGGMLGNNSCGLHSIIYGSVRDHILEIEALLADGSEIKFGELETSEFLAKAACRNGSAEEKICKFFYDSLSSAETRMEIIENFPDPVLKRRNNGYAVDALLDTDPFVSNGKKINLCRLLAGSEGTLAFATSLKLDLTEIPSGKNGLLCAHFSSMSEALLANIKALAFEPIAIELIDDYIINCTRENPEQSRNRFFVKGNPGVILIIEFLDKDIEAIRRKSLALQQVLEKEGYGYHYPLYTDPGEIQKIWDLRKAGLGVLLNIPGERRSVQVIEDTAVSPELYPRYFAEFEQILQKYKLVCSYYGHIATGELHFSPLLNLKDPGDISIYRSIATEISVLVKKYRGSLSGEHGDGRLRGEFIPYMLGEHNYRLIKEIKRTFDPDGIFNPGKITDTPSITASLRYPQDAISRKIETTFIYPEKEGLLHAVEKCSGSGDCRKSSVIGGTMCPTFMVSHDEDKSTRGRANILREFLTNSRKKNPFDHEEILKVMDLCISCKACKSECPSNVDMAAFKAEFLQHYYLSHPIPVRSWLTGWLPRINSFGIKLGPVTNAITSLKIFNRIMGFSDKRRLPSLSKITLKKWGGRNLNGQAVSFPNGSVYFFADEFTNFNECETGIAAILLLENLGYKVIIPDHVESGRTLISKGMLKEARKVAVKNISLLAGLVTDEIPLIGLEPSAVLTFRDEYPSMFSGSEGEKALSLAKNVLLFDEFISREFDSGRIKSSSFTTDHRSILLHGHCQQKSVASTAPTIKALSIPANYEVMEIPGGCCGMAGAFGYEKEHYEMSMKIGELSLFPAVRNAGKETLISATGTSCRHQIFDGTGRKAFHPAEILYGALLNRREQK
ncbi:MAG TPA: FAD-linked oxidase C-terminal domain-containing protein [Bacteroidales bacterium]|nr:FAD-linked oxidase C-terminal domain-containing protein [Bacteroidales bacterium]